MTLAHSTPLSRPPVPPGKAPRAFKRPAALAMALLWLAPTLASADGSWAATASPVQVLMADREAVSDALSPPADVPPESAIREVIWRFDVPPDLAVRARLCHAKGCIDLPTARGRSRALAGFSADAPLHFHFKLRPEQRRGGRVQGLQVIVNYQRPAP